MAQLRAQTRTQRPDQGRTGTGAPTEDPVSRGVPARTLETPFAPRGLLAEALIEEIGDRTEEAVVGRPAAASLVGGHDTGVLDPGGSR